MTDTHLMFKPHSVILFQGDSITAAGRDYSRIGPNSPEGLGVGYVRKIADAFLRDNPGKHLQFYNRGVSGNRIQDLYTRWEMDSLLLIPDLISILIGVNDTWNQLVLGLGSDPDEYRVLSRKILEKTRKALPDSKFVLCEPFILLTGQVTEEWEADVTQRQGIIRDLAEEYAGVLVPFQAALDQEAQHVPPHRLLDDGVHPTDRGHQVLAECWMKTVLG